MYGIVVLAAVVSAGIESADPPGAATAPADEQPDGAIETFVLTPIHMTSFSMQVPAEMVGPVTNNTCHAWNGHVESCYLPARRLDNGKPSKQPELENLLERHLSAILGAWKPGAWPADGAGINISLEQYASFEHLWLTHRIQINENLGTCWLDGRDDPQARIVQAASQPAAEIEIEIFGGTRDAKGYPAKVRF
jgi:hypothetical protein